MVSGAIERNCQNIPKKLSRHGRSYSRSPSPRLRSPSPRRSKGRSCIRSFSRSRSYSQSRSLPKRERDVECVDRLRSPRLSRSPKRQKVSPESSRSWKHTPLSDERSPEGRGSPSNRDNRRANGSDYGGSPMYRSRSPIKEGERESPRNEGARSRGPYEENGRDRSVSLAARIDKTGREDNNDDYKVLREADYVRTAPYSDEEIHDIRKRFAEYFIGNIEGY